MNALNVRPGPARAILTMAVVVGVAIATWYGAMWQFKRFWTPDPEIISRASLRAVRQQNELIPFTARFVAVVTAEERRFGLQARKTLIMPGTVRYAIDLAKLHDGDMIWNAATRTLTVRLPVPRIEGPEIDLTAIREYSGGGVLMALTRAEDDLDAANRKAGQADLLHQASDPLPLKMARDAGRIAIERSFAMPLKAAGLDPTVVVKFVDEK